MLEVASTSCCLTGRFCALTRRPGRGRPRPRRRRGARVEPAPLPAGSATGGRAGPVSAGPVEASALLGPDQGKVQADGPPVFLPPGGVATVQRAGNGGADRLQAAQLL